MYIFFDLNTNNSIDLHEMTVICLCLMRGNKLKKVSAESLIIKVLKTNRYNNLLTLFSKNNL